MEKKIPYEIDWEEQWKTHAPGFRDGYLTLPGVHGDVRLKAGPGFGDLSHPTTRLVLERMGEIVPNRVVIDIGCGSGVLSCAAIGMGATEVYAIDIDPLALVHARENALLNGMDGKIRCSFADGLRGKPLGKCVAVMNMIQSEQVHAWESVSFLHDRIDSLVTSGILAVDEEKYFALCAAWGWAPQGRSTECGWCAYTLARQVH